MVQIQGGRMMNIKDKMEFPDEYEKLQEEKTAKAYIRYDTVRMHISESIEVLRAEEEHIHILKAFEVFSNEEYLEACVHIQKALMIYEKALEKARQAYFKERDK